VPWMVAQGLLHPIRRPVTTGDGKLVFAGDSQFKIKSSPARALRGWTSLLYTLFEQVFAETRASPNRSETSRCQMSRARCWTGERSTVRIVCGLRVRPMATGSVGAAATEGVSGGGCGVCAGSFGVGFDAVAGEAHCVTSSRQDVSMSVDQFQYYP